MDWQKAESESAALRSAAEGEIPAMKKPKLSYFEQEDVLLSAGE